MTTEYLAAAYETDERNIKQNFNNNKERFIEGKHYFYLDGEILKEFLQVENFYWQNMSKIRHLYLWTEKGALLHAKSLNTDKAWQLYESLVDFYFNVTTATNNIDVEKRIKNKHTKYTLV